MRAKSRSERIMRGWFKRSSCVGCLFCRRYTRYIESSALLASEVSHWQIKFEAWGDIWRIRKCISAWLKLSEYSKSLVARKNSWRGRGKQLVKIYEEFALCCVVWARKIGQQMGRLLRASWRAPDWYVGQGVFNAVVVSSGLSGLSTAAGRIVVSSTTEVAG